MSPSLRIAVISHEIDDFENSGYLLNRLAAEWQRRGIEIAIVKGTRQPLPAADLALLHTDITVVGEDYAKIIEHYPRVINGRVRDISKTAFSALLVRRDDGYRGPVIVKTRMNYGGLREMQQRYLQGDMNSTISIQRPWRRVEWLQEYPIFNSPAEVPHGVWQNPKLVVEKFLPERNGAGEYILRIWVFFGDREIYYQCVSNEPVVKSTNTLRRETLDPAQLPESLRDTRSRLGFDYGKFDFGINDGAAGLYDVNRTPGFPPNRSESPEVAANMRLLSAGLDCFID
jgi:hypothetical protein